MANRGMKLDRIDLKILATIQQHGRITKLALAESVGLSPTPCWNRLKRLEDRGVIEGYHGRIALASLGSYATIWTEVVLRSHRAEDFATFEAIVHKLDMICECWAVGGGIDYLLKFVACNIDHYQRLIDELLDTNAGIDRYFSYIVTRQVKLSTQLPLDALLTDT